MKTNKLVVRSYDANVIVNLVRELQEVFFEYLEKTNDYNQILVFQLKSKNKFIDEISMKPDLLGLSIIFHNNYNSNKENFKTWHTYEEYKNGNWEREFIERFQKI